jgi:hypothetical protein
LYLARPCPASSGRLLVIASCALSCFAVMANWCLSGADFWNWCT